MTQQQQSGRMCGHESETGGAWLFTCRVWLGYGLVFGIKPVTQQSRSCCAAGSGAAGRRKTCRAAAAQQISGGFRAVAARQLRSCCASGFSARKTCCATVALLLHDRLLGSENPLRISCATGFRSFETSAGPPHDCCSCAAAGFLPCAPAAQLLRSRLLQQVATSGCYIRRVAVSLQTSHSCAVAAPTHPCAPPSVAAGPADGRNK